MIIRDISVPGTEEISTTEVTLSQAEVDSITDWNDVTLEFVVPASRRRIRIYTVEVEARSGQNEDPALTLELFVDTTSLGVFQLDPSIIQLNTIELFLDDNALADLQTAVSGGEIDNLSLEITADVETARITQAYLDSTEAVSVDTVITATLIEDVSGTPTTRATKIITPSASLGTTEYTLTSAEEASIVDRSKLSVDLSATGSNAVRVTQAYMDSSQITNPPAPTTGVWPGTTIKYDPGSFLNVGTNKSIAKMTTAFNSYVKNYPNMKGIVWRERWGKFETSQGVYDWSDLTTMVNMAAAAGKWVCFMPDWKGFGSNVAVNVVPAYMRNNPTYSDGYHFTGTQTLAKMYDTNVNAAMMAAMQDLASNFNTNDNLHLVAYPETAYGKSNLDPTYSQSAYQQFYVDLINNHADYFTETLGHVLLNFKLDIKALAAVCASRNVGIGSPDQRPYDPGLVAGNFGVYAEQRQYAGITPIMPWIQFPNYCETANYPASHPIYPGQTRTPLTADELMYNSWWYCKANYIGWQQSGCNGSNFANGIAALDGFVANGDFPVFVQGT